MSHQTGALLMTSEFHTIELINRTRHPRLVQIMYKHVPVFQAIWDVSWDTGIAVDANLPDAMEEGSLQR